MPIITDIFFDLDHTLWDFDRNSEKAFEALLAAHQIPVALEDFLEVYIPINEQYWVAYRENKVSAQQLKIGRLKDTFKLFAIKLTDLDLQLMAEQYLELLTEFNSLFADAIPTLQYLYPQYNLHIITNGFDKVQQIKIDRSGLRSYFKSVTTSEEVGVKKPDAKIFYQALDKAQAKAHKTMMIGDNYEADIQGALNIGMRVIHYNYHKEQVPKDIKQITDLSNLTKEL